MNGVSTPDASMRCQFREREASTPCHLSEDVFRIPSAGAVREQGEFMRTACLLLRAVFTASLLEVQAHSLESS